MECIKLEEVNQLVANDSEQGDHFGSSVALSSDGLVAMVGADADSTKASNAGKVYTYKRDSIDADWEEVSQLTVSDGKKCDHFGISIALSADGLVAIVGALYEDTKVNNIGKVYTYKRSDINADWEEVNKIIVNNSKVDDYFGTSVALSADGLVAMIGAFLENTRAYNAGTIYTYKRNSIDEDWQEVNQLVASDGDEFDHFGKSVALSADGLKAIVGAHFKDTVADNAGEVYIYKRDSIDADWVEVSQLTASDGKEDDFFGKSVAMSGDGTVVMVGIDDENIESSNTGKVYTYKTQ